MKHNTRHTGLTIEQVLESRQKHGANILVAPESDSVLRNLLMRFTGPFGHCFKHKKGPKIGQPYPDADPLIFVLEIAAVLSILVSCIEYMEESNFHVFFEPIGIIVAILLAVGLAFYFEFQADKAFSALNEKNDEELVKVIRNGSVTKVKKQDVVVGDIVVLATGDEIPADGDLLEAVALQIDESSLTGEPVCGKTVNPEEFDENATYPSNHVLRSTKVMEGHGVMRVTRVGEKTEFGKVFREVQIDDSIKTPLNEQLDGLGNWITVTSYVIGALVVFGHVAWWFMQGNPVDIHFVYFVLQKIMVAVTLIVVAVPEGLPMAVTLSLAYSMRAMLRTNNLVRKMHACETMGATTVICTDKTGTLTQNKMQVAESTFSKITPELALGIAVNSTASLDFTDASPKPVGNPTEGALLLWLHDQDYDYRELKYNAEVVGEVPFSTEKKYMQTTITMRNGEPEEGGRRENQCVMRNDSIAQPNNELRITNYALQTTFTKGAPEIVFAMCQESDLGKDELEKTLAYYQSKAYRTIGFAQDNRFLGVVAISDPVREDVPVAVAECLKAGIDVKIVTGDTPGTAIEIGRQIGLFGNNGFNGLNGFNETSETPETSCVITGAELAQLSDEELQERVLDLKIIARARPMDKKRLVEALQARNQVVSVTGDGTNDAPALSQAHVGLSMGDGTAVAKEASDITIIDNSFSSIGKAVMWGRSLYKNIQRFLLFQLTVNVTACCIVLVGAFVGTDSPLSVTQMLWINLIMDTFGAMALASLPPSRDVMKEMPRKRGSKKPADMSNWAFFREQWRMRSFIVSRPMLKEILSVGVFFFLLLFGFLLIFQHADINSVADFIGFEWKRDHNVVTPYEQTLLFSIFVWTHFFYMFNARAFATGQSVFSLRMSKGFWTIVAVIVVGQLLITEGMYNFFNVEPMLYNADHTCGPLDLLIIVAFSSLVVWVREGWRKIKTL